MSLVPYLLLLLLPSLWALSGRAGERGERAARLAIAIVLALFIGLRREVSLDWDAYLLMFERANAYALADALALNDPAYMLLMRAVGSLGLGVGIFNLAGAALFVAGLLLFCRDRPRPWLALLVALPVLVVLVAMGFARQSLAAGLAMLAIHLASRERGGAAWTLLLFAPLFHWTAAILLPLGLAFDAARPPRPRAWLVAGCLAAVAVLAAIPLLPALSLRIVLAGESGGAVLRALPTLAALGGYALLLRRDALPANEARLAAPLAALAVFVVILVLPFSTLSDRFGFYAVPFQALVFARLPSLAPDRRLRAAAAAAIGAVYAAMLAAWLVLGSYRDCWMPYRSYLERPELLLRAQPPERPRLQACHGTLPGAARSS